MRQLHSSKVLGLIRLQATLVIIAVARTAAQCSQVVDAARLAMPTTFHAVVPAFSQVKINPQRR